MSSNIVVRIALKVDLDEIVDFAFRINNKLESSSSFCSKNEASIRKDLYEGILNKTLICAWRGDDIIGMISAYKDEPKRNIDSFILIDSTICDYQETAQLLLSQMKQKMPKGFHFTFFYSKENVECSTFLKKLNALQKPNEYGMLFLANDINHVQKSDKVQLLPDLYHFDFIELHDSIFPDIYVSGNDIILDHKKNHYVYACIENNKIKAYSVLWLRGTLRATAEIIAVHKEYLHQGYGRMVLSHLIHTAIVDFGMESVDLIVDNNNENAFKLYMDIGFTVEFENHCCELY